MQLAFGDTLAVDPDAIRASEIANDQMITDLCDTTMTSGHLSGVELHITFLMSAEE